MTASTLSEQQCKSLSEILARFARECEAEAVAVCDAGGNLIAQENPGGKVPVENAAALAAGSFAATRELARLVEESGFKSIYHKGRKSGVLIHALGGEYLLLVILGSESVEGFVRLFVKNVGGQINAVLTAAPAGTGESTEFEVKTREKTA